MLKEKQKWCRFISKIYVSLNIHGRPPLFPLFSTQIILVITNRTLFHIVGLTRRVQIRLMDLLGLLQATIKSLKVGPFKDNHKSSTNRFTQICYQPKCQFRDQIGHIAKSKFKFSFSDGPVFKFSFGCQLAIKSLNVGALKRCVVWHLLFYQACDMVPVNSDT
jgi:hypothetical protein